MSLPREQQEILYHTAYHAAQGLYCGDSQDMQELITAGLMEEAGRKGFVPEAYFRITSKGREKYLAERNAPPTDEQRLRKLSSLESRVQDLILKQDAQGRWVEDGNISCSTFIGNLRLLCEYVELAH